MYYGIVEEHMDLFGVTNAVTKAYNNGIKDLTEITTTTPFESNVITMPKKETTNVPKFKVIVKVVDDEGVGLAIPSGKSLTVKLIGANTEAFTDGIVFAQRAISSTSADCAIGSALLDTYLARNYKYWKVTFTIESGGVLTSGKVYGNIQPEM